MEWADGLPPPPREVYGLVEAARSVGLWLHWARYEYHARLQGGRYKLTAPRSSRAIVATDDLDDIRAYLHTR